MFFIDNVLRCRLQLIAIYSHFYYSVRAKFFGLVHSFKKEFGNDAISRRACSIVY